MLNVRRQDTKLRPRSRLHEEYSRPDTPFSLPHRFIAYYRVLYTNTINQTEKQQVLYNCD